MQLLYGITIISLIISSTILIIIAIMILISIVILIMPPIVWVLIQECSFVCCKLGIRVQRCELGFRVAPKP